MKPASSCVDPACTGLWCRETSGAESCLPTTRVVAIQPSGTFGWPGAGHTASRNGRLALLAALRHIAARVTVDNRWQLSTVHAMVPLDARASRGEDPELDRFYAHASVWSLAARTPQPDLGEPAPAPAQPPPTTRARPPQNSLPVGNYIKEPEPANTPVLIAVGFGAGAVAGGVWGQFVAATGFDVGYIAWAVGLVVGGFVYVARGPQAPAMARLSACGGTLLAVVLSRWLTMQVYDLGLEFVDLIFTLLALATAWAVSTGGGWGGIQPGLKTPTRATLQPPPVGATVSIQSHSGLVHDPFYPCSDGEPMAENTTQYRWIVTIRENLDSLLPQAFVAADLFWYPVEGDNQTRRAPDVLVALDRPKGDRSSYLQWREDGKPPDVVFEVWSPGNTLGEIWRKVQWYGRFGVRELISWNPEKSHLTVWVRQGDDLEVAESNAGYESPLLGCTFEVIDDTLVITGPDGKPFRTMEEIRDALSAAEARAEREAARAEQQTARADREAARAQALAEKLRALGIDPDA